MKQSSAMSILYLEYVEWFNSYMLPVCNEFFVKCPNLLCADLVMLFDEICRLHRSPVYESYKLDTDMIQLLWEINRLMLSALGWVYYIRNEVSYSDIAFVAGEVDNEYYGIVRNCQRLGDRLSSKEVRIYTFFISEVDEIVSSIKDYYFY